MFSGLLVFEKERTAAQAFGFYVAWVVAAALLGAIAGMAALQYAHFTDGVQHTTTFQEGYAIGARWGRIVPMPFCLVLAFTIVHRKRQGFACYLLVLASGILAAFGGYLIGLIPIAYLTTRPALSPGESTHPQAKAPDPS